MKLKRTPSGIFKFSDKPFVLNIFATKQEASVSYGEGKDMMWHEIIKDFNMIGKDPQVKELTDFRAFGGYKHKREIIEVSVGTRYELVKPITREEEVYTGKDFITKTVTHTEKTHWNKIIVSPRRIMLTRGYYYGRQED